MFVALVNRVRIIKDFLRMTLIFVYFLYKIAVKGHYKATESSMSLLSLPGTFPDDLTSTSTNLANFLFNASLVALMNFQVSLYHKNIIRSLAFVNEASQTF